MEKSPILMLPVKGLPKVFFMIYEGFIFLRLSILLTFRVIYLMRHSGNITFNAQFMTI